MWVYFNGRLYNDDINELKKEAETDANNIYDILYKLQIQSITDSVNFFKIKANR